jgi:hypothetical protein
VTILAKRISALEASRSVRAEAPPILDLPSIEELERSLNAAQAEVHRREALPLDEQLALERADLAQMLDAGPPPGVVGADAYRPGGLFIRWKQQDIRHLEIALLARDGRVDEEAAKGMREDASNFLRGFTDELMPLPIRAREPAEARTLSNISSSGTALCT